MVWNRIKDALGRGDRNDDPDIPWVEAADNPWGVRVLDVRPLTHTMLSVTQDEECARNAVSFGQDDGTGFIGVEPLSADRTPADLRFPIDRLLADGPLFIPREMEHKWAIFHHRGRVICVRSWTRQVLMVAHVEIHGNFAEITEIRGSADDGAYDPGFTVRFLDYLLRSHVLSSPYPAPLPPGMEKVPRDAAMWCMGAFGNLAEFATATAFERREPEVPLRSVSMLHIAVARGDVAAVNDCLGGGMPVDLLGNDGLAPLHWAVVTGNPDLIPLLVERGSPVDVRSVNDETSLMYAAERAAMDQLSCLLDLGAAVNAADVRGFTALHRTAEMGHVAAARALLERGAHRDVEAMGHTPLSLAEARGETEIISLLTS